MGVWGCRGVGVWGCGGVGVWGCGGVGVWGCGGVGVWVCGGGQLPPTGPMWGTRHYITLHYIALRDMK